jgi:hypothetical protein
VKKMSEFDQQVAVLSEIAAICLASMPMMEEMSNFFIAHQKKLPVQADDLRVDNNLFSKFKRLMKAIDATQPAISAFTFAVVKTGSGNTMDCISALKELILSATAVVEEAEDLLSSYAGYIPEGSDQPLIDCMEAMKPILEAAKLSFNTEDGD